MPFKRGTSGNSNGRPSKSNTWSAMVAKVGRQKVDDDLWQTGKKMSRKEYVVRAIFKMAEEGNVRAAQALWDREDGKPMQQIIQETDTHVHVTREIVDGELDGKELEDPEVD